MGLVSGSRSLDLVEGERLINHQCRHHMKEDFEREGWIMDSMKGERDLLHCVDTVYSVKRIFWTFLSWLNRRAREQPCTLNLLKEK